VDRHDTSFCTYEAHRNTVLVNDAKQLVICESPRYLEFVTATHDIHVHCHVVVEELHVILHVAIQPTHKGSKMDHVRWFVFLKQLLGLLIISIFDKHLQ